MLSISEDIKGLDLSFQLDERQTAIIASAVKQEWWDLVQKLMENEIKLLNVQLINTGTENPQQILANHAIAKGAGMFYIGFVQRLQMILAEQQYISQGIGTPENPERPPYPTEFTESPQDEAS